MMQDFEPSLLPSWVTAYEQWRGELYDVAFARLGEIPGFELICEVAIPAQVLVILMLGQASAEKSFDWMAERWTPTDFFNELSRPLIPQLMKHIYK